MAAAPVDCCPPVPRILLRGFAARGGQYGVAKQPHVPRCPGLAACVPMDDRAAAPTQRRDVPAAWGADEDGAPRIGHRRLSRAPKSAAKSPPVALPGGSRPHQMAPCRASVRSYPRSGRPCPRSLVASPGCSGGPSILQVMDVPEAPPRRPASTRVHVGHASTGLLHA